jgi:hypothetical protein
MFKRGGFASYTKTGRGISMGRALGEGLARGGSKNSTSENKDEPSFCVGFMTIILVLYILHTITRVTKHNIQ